MLAASHKTFIAQVKFWLLNLVWLLDVVVVLLTLGFISPSLHSYVLFSDWIDREGTLL